MIAESVVYVKIFSGIYAERFRYLAKHTKINENDFTKLSKTILDTLEKLNLTDYELTILQRNLRTLLQNTPALSYK